ncbi:MAG: glycerol-3-phosphate 1-O-acyltransferase PlsY [Dokdonella sp.]|uniref:glycerol-3-phosphate 1-O-acyltransferase PlsY n=1 Tax=Dokdonella sp. TaxID=2291710 RepID=UPI0031CAB17B|nr:glycerol-3-phosphate 1-O-acyltransferase PlsY [Xanthomonadales bacterium]MBL0223054.1 glycerol-3-phosphate 1-O-acyltransferase PlsY [Xanthomonadales bacterium]
MALLLAKLVVAYLLGSLSGSLLLGRLRGIDIRQSGSGNAGGTNALRVVGWRFALGVVVIDVGKGALAALLGLAPIGGTAATPFDAVTVAAACSFAAVIGHCWPVYFGFRGGKGAGTAVGAILVMAPMLAGMMVVLWLLVVASTRFVGLATVLAALGFPVFVLLAEYFGHPQADAMLVFSIAVALLIVCTHRGNLLRLWLGQEPRLGAGGKP